MMGAMLWVSMLAMMLVAVTSWMDFWLPLDLWLERHHISSANVMWSWCVINFAATVLLVLAT